MQYLLIAGIVALLLILIGMDIGSSFLSASLLYALLSGGSISSYARTAFTTNNSYSLLAVPLFMLAGLLMERSGIAGSLVDLCEALLRKVKGGMAAVIPLVSMIFGTLCGSGMATVSTIGSITIERFEKLGYDRRYSSALVAASGPLGYMIPPNMNAIIFGLVSTASVSALFLATIVPGVIWGIGYIIMNRFMYARYYTKREYVYVPDSANELLKDKKKKSADDQINRKPVSIGRAFVSAIPALLMPVIILGGIYGGLCTPTEAGAVSSLYALIVGVIIYRKLKGKNTLQCFADTGTSLGTIMIIFPFVMIFSKIMVLNGLPTALMTFVSGLQIPKFVILLITDLILLVAGCFFDAPILTLVLPPMMIPTMNMLGVTATQFGVIVFMAIGIGAFTPPMAANLFVAARVGKVNLREMLKPLMPFLFGVAIPVMLLVTFIPELSTWLPELVLGMPCV